MLPQATFPPLLADISDLQLYTIDLGADAGYSRLTRR